MVHQQYHKWKHFLKVWYIQILPMIHPMSFWLTNIQRYIRQVRRRDWVIFHSWRRYHWSKMTIFRHRRQRQRAFRYIWIGEQRLRWISCILQWWKSLWCKSFVCKRKIVRFRIDRDKKIRYRFRFWHNSRFRSIRNLHCIQSWWRYHNHRVIIQSKVREFRFWWICKIRWQRQQRKPSKIHNFLDL